MQKFLIPPWPWDDWRFENLGVQILIQSFLKKTCFASWSCKIFASLVPPSLPDSPNQPQNNKTKIFIWVFIILGIYNFDGVSHSLLNTSSYICRHLPVSAIVYTNVHYQNDNKKHWPNFLLWIANIIFFHPVYLSNIVQWTITSRFFLLNFEFGDNFQPCPFEPKSL